MNDFLLDPESKDLQINATGDFVVGFSDNQNKALLIDLPKGSIKKYPTATVGAMSFLEQEDTGAFLREIRDKFTDDGMKVNSLKFASDGKLYIDAEY